MAGPATYKKYHMVMLARLNLIFTGGETFFYIITLIVKIKTTKSSSFGATVAVSS